jgi:hypothetical protein
MNKLIDQCPVCRSEFIVTELFCGNCATTISGHFEVLSSPLSRLSSEQLNFIHTFIRCEGKFNRMEEELNISYPTLRNRFDDILVSMGYESRDDLNNAEISKEDRMEILHQLEQGLIEPAEAEIKLRGT